MRKFPLLFVLILFSVEAGARSVDPDDARHVAQNFWQARTGHAVTLEQHFPKGVPQSMFFFAPDNADGFVIVAADDVARPILGFSFSQPLPDEVPAEPRYWLFTLDAQISSAVANKLPASYPDLWQLLRAGTSIPIPALDAAAPAVPPLLSTTWNQSPRYNSLCPTNDGGYPPAGCTVIATTQIMRYWAFPAVGFGSAAYYHRRYGQLSANYGATHYDWDAMPNTLNNATGDQEHAVATLIYHCGVAANMDYNPMGSGAAIHSHIKGQPSAGLGLIDHFHYDPSLSLVQRDTVDDALWTQMLLDDIAAGRPVLYAGYDNESGHAFVCDGYDSLGFFHFNWGWGGSCDGYYPLSAIDPARGGWGTPPDYYFDLRQEAVFGLQPDRRLYLSDTTVSLLRSNDTALVTVVSTAADATPWSASSSDSWITLSATSGPGNATLSTLSISALPNDSGRSRSAVVTITQGAHSAHINVIQRACDKEDCCYIEAQLDNPWANGWNGSSLTIADAEGFPYADLTLNSRTLNTRLAVCPDSIQLHWNSGRYDSLCVFSLFDGLGHVLFHHALHTPLAEGLMTVIPAPCASSDTTITALPYHWCMEGHNMQGWSAYSANTANASAMGINLFSNTGNYVFSFSSRNRTDDYNQYLISPRIELDQPSILAFDYMACRASLPCESFRVFYSTTDTALASFSHLLCDTSVTNYDEWESLRLNLPAEARYVMVNYYSNRSKYFYIKNVSLTAPLPADTMYLLVPHAKFFLRGEGTRNMSFIISDTTYSEFVASVAANCHARMGSQSAQVVGDYSFSDLDLSCTYLSSTLSSVKYKIQSADFHVSAIPEGYQLSGYFHVDGNMVIHVVLRAAADHPGYYTVRAISDDTLAGSVEGAGCFEDGASVTLSAHPNAGYHFVRWSDGVTDNPRSIILVSDTLFVAHFEQGDVAIANLAPSVVTLFPNPSSGLVNIQAEGVQNVVVFDANGRRLLSLGSVSQLDLSALPRGLYWLYITTAQGSVLQRLVID